MSLFGLALKKGAQFADGLLDDVAIQAKQADDVFDEKAWLEANPRPPGSARNNPEVKAWYNRYYREKNKEKIRRQQAEYYQENAEAKREYARRHRIDNNESVTAGQRRRYHENSEKIKKDQKRYREKNKEKIRAAQQAYRDRDRAGWNARGSASRAERIKRVVPWSDPAKTKEIYDTAIEVSRITGMPWEVDHVMPMQGSGVSGLHHQDNLMIVPKYDNRSKGAKFEPGDLPPRAGIRNARALLKRIKEEHGLLGPIE